MKCPYCGDELEQGYIKSSQVLFWGKDKELGFVLGNVRLSKNPLRGFFCGHFVPSGYCDKCRKIIVSLDETEERN